MSPLNLPQAFNLAFRHYQDGVLDQAEVLCREILAAVPGHADSLQLLGMIACRAGRHEVAADLFRQLNALHPGNAACHSNLGLALRALGRLEESSQAFREAVRLGLGFPDAHLGLVDVLQALDRPEESLGVLRDAVRLWPETPEFHFRLGQLLCLLGHLEESGLAYREAIRLRPGFGEAHINLGHTLNSLSRLEESLAANREAILLCPDAPEPRNNQGNVLQALGRLEESLDSYREALRLRPGYPEARGNLGTSLLALGRHEEAIAAYREALSLRPGFPAIHSNLCYALNFLPRPDHADIAREHREWGRCHAFPLRRNIPAHANDRDPRRRLRLGYVSPDFRDHAVARFLLPLLTRHDHAGFEVFCYSDAPVADTFTRRVRDCSDHWRNTSGLTDNRLADLIHADRVDILVDLAQHTSGNRLSVFARRPAPVQVAYLGYPATTGLETIGHRITDALADPPGRTEHLHTERLVRLPGCAWCFSPPDDSPAPGEAPVLAAGHITFGCFSNRAKLNAPLFDLWIRILQSLPASRLKLKSATFQDPAALRETIAFFGRGGIAPSRLEICGFARTYREHLEHYRTVDIALDSHPYHGTTTTCEALWMGVPVVTLEGLAHTSRVGVSLLSAAGLPELVAATPAQYVEKALHLAADPAGLAAMRRGMRGRLLASRLMDGDSFARSMEAACREMWAEWVGLPP